jgi:hypothetical protein
LGTGHILADLAFVAIGLLIGASAIKKWRMLPELPRLEETPSESFLRGLYMPARFSMVAGSGWFVSLGLFAFAMDLEHSLRNHILKDLVWIPYYLFLASAIFWGIMFFSLYFTGRPRALVPPVYRNE